MMKCHNNQKKGSPHLIDQLSPAGVLHHLCNVGVPIPGSGHATSILDYTASRASSDISVHDCLFLEGRFARAGKCVLQHTN